MVNGVFKLEWRGLSLHFEAEANLFCRDVVCGELLMRRAHCVAYVNPVF